MRVSCLALLLSFLLVLPLIAQTNRGSIRGSVMDPSGASVPDVEIQAENVGTRIRSATKSNDTGGFVFVSLQPGTYRLIAEVVGFKRAVSDDAYQAAPSLGLEVAGMEFGLADMNYRLP